MNTETKDKKVLAKNMVLHQTNFNNMDFATLLN